MTACPKSRGRYACHADCLCARGESRAWLRQVLGLADDEDSLLAVADAMRHEAWWQTIPKYVEPAPVAGEITCR